MGAKVVCPYLEGMLNPATREAVLNAAPDAVFHRIDTWDDCGYSRLLCALWAAGESFVVVEQDVVPPDDFLESFETCPHRMCVVEPRLRPGLAWFGCVRWRAELLAEHPTLMAFAQCRDDDGAPAWDWHRVDVRFEERFRGERLAPHFHGPFCEHLRGSERAS